MRLLIGRENITSVAKIERERKKQTESNRLDACTYAVRARASVMLCGCCSFFSLIHCMHKTHTLGHSYHWNISFDDHDNYSSSGGQATATTAPPTKQLKTVTPYTELARIKEKKKKYDELRMNFRANTL